MCVWGHFEQSGKTAVWDGWELRRVNWAGAGPVMTLYKKITMTPAVVREERMLIIPDPMFLFSTLTYY